jgi:hypothetical protein
MVVPAVFPVTGGIVGVLRSLCLVPRLSIRRLAH